MRIDRRTFILGLSVFGGTSQFWWLLNSASWAQEEIDSDWADSDWADSELGEDWGVEDDGYDLAEEDFTTDWRDGGIPNLDGRIPGFLWLDPVQAAAVDAPSDEDRLTKNYDVRNPARHFNSFGELAPALDEFFKKGYVDAIPSDMMGKAKSHSDNVERHPPPADLRGFFAERPDLVAALALPAAAFAVDKVVGGDFTLSAPKLGGETSVSASLSFQHWSVSEASLKVQAIVPVGSYNAAVELSGSASSLRAQPIGTAINLSIRVGF
ncbi:hypothetical protein [Mesorhizobium sp.]|uniref:hypothetical protein n=1 Tax=Mesorhizobium sp. TaxID=1871066 RepID=UPI000FE9A82A|nr:hypothetical protein [Mesorhizobium sp.]RWI99973.1 MAG: hypothetical protein EOR23_31955 [Mesorhizobium sp.]RWM04970.1 MAG: hypothetical protein EOR71_25600 [Mesorhizobium sp.]RWO82166.1 MAG: hypothetical protein EOQ95_27640 [Mesorhizobium sp.]